MWRGLGTGGAAGFDAEEVADEEIGAAAFAVGGFGSAVVGAGDDEHFKIFAGFFEGVDDLHGGGGIDVVIEFADHEQEFALEFMGVHDVGAADVTIIDGPAHPLFIPPDFVHAVVMAAAIGDGDFIKISVIEEGAQGVLAASGAAVDADAGEVHFKVLGGGGFDPENAVGEAGIGEVFPADVMEFFGAVAGAHAVHLDDNEAEFGNFLLAVKGFE